MPIPKRFLTATSRAARLVSGILAATDDYQKPLHEARCDQELIELNLALGLRCASLAQELYGDQAQSVLDGFAFDALAYERRLSGETA